MLARWTRVVIRWRLVVISAWLVVLALGGAAAVALPGLLTTSLDVPGTSSSQANRVLISHFGEDIEGTFTVIVPTGHDTPAELRSAQRRVAASASSIRSASISQERNLGGDLYVEVATTLSLQQAAPKTAALRRALAHQGLGSAMVTGPPALQHDITPVLAGDLHRGDVLALVLALVLLTLALGVSWAVLVPFAVAVSTSAGSLGVIYLLARHFLMVLYVPNVVELIGLGLAIDYSLLMVHRFRAEVRGGDGDTGTALERTMSTAGHTVIVSGVAFGAGLVTMLGIPVPFVRSLGTAGLVVPLVSLVSALTLLPALLSLLGQRGVRAVGFRGAMTRRDESHGAWARVARAAVRRPVVTLAMALAILAGAGVSVMWLQVTPGSLTAIPANLQSSKALAFMRHHVGAGLVSPVEIVIDSGAARGSTTPAMSAARLSLAEAILRQPGVALVAIDSVAPYVDRSGRYARILVVGQQEFGSQATQRLVASLRDDVIPRIHFPAGARVFLGGAPAQGVDFLDAVYGAFPWIILVAMALALVMLIRAYRSLLLALVAVLLDLVSVGAAYGVLVAVFRDGVGSSILHTYRVSQLEGWVPVLVFAMLFGLSMDYEVFIVARMREAYDRGLPGEQAIVEGLAHTGAVVSSAAVIMVGALLGLVFGHVAGLQELGVGLSLGVLIDATVVRGLLLPSIMAIAGRWNWYLPSSIARILMVPASPL